VRKRESREAKKRTRAAGRAERKGGSVRMAGEMGVRVQETHKRTDERHSADHLNDTCGKLANNGDLFKQDITAHGFMFN
jgi:hypothetical protein